MKSLIITLCALAVQLVLSVKAGDENINFVTVTVPTQSKIYTKAQLAKLTKQFKPRIDNPKAKRIKQDKNAGKVSSKVKTQIIGGSAALRGQFPWQVAVHIDGRALCGGSLILTNWVVTAAHCTYQKTNFSVRIGTIDYAVIPAGGQLIFTTLKYEHPAYSSITYENDITLLKLPEHVTLSEFMSTIRLPSNSDATKTFEGADVTVSGFGRTSQNSAASRYLNWVDDKVISNAQCSESFSPYIKATTICTFTPQKSACNGDSGGPLVLKDSTGTSILIGLVSFGGNTCADTPKAYTRTASYLGWMSDVIQQDVSGPEPSTTSVSPTPATSSSSTTTLTTTTTTTPQPTTTIPTTTSPPTTTKPISIIPTTSPTTTTTPTASSPTASPTEMTPTSMKTSVDPTTTSSISKSTTKSPGTTKKTPAPKCAAADFSTLQKCCKPPRKDLISINPKDKSCPGANNKVFNNYFLNKQQNPNADFAIQYSDAKVQKALIKDACFANCYFLKQSMFLPNGTINIAKLTEILTQTNKDSSWKSQISNAVDICNLHLENVKVPVFVNGKSSCSGEALVMLQCTLMNSLNSCERVMDKTCTSKWTLFDACNKNIFLT